MESCCSCDKPLKKNDNKMTTDSGLVFHRACLENILNAKHKTDNQVCVKSVSLLVISHKNISNTFLCLIKRGNWSFS